MTKTIKISDYLQPQFYSCMSKGMFAKLNKAFADGCTEIEVEISDFETMMSNYKEKMRYVQGD